MKRGAAFLLVAFLAAASTALVVAPAWVPAIALVLSVAALRRGRRAFLAFVAIATGINVLLMAIAVPGPDPHHLGPVPWGLSGALLGLAGGVRLSAVTGLNLAVLSWLPAERILESLRLPPRTTGTLGAVLLTAHDLGRDFERLVLARRLDGEWPDGALRRARAAAALLPPLVVSSLRRAEARRDALRLAGHDTGPRFVPVVAVTALAVAGRLAFLALPNVALTYVVVFLGGALFGTRTGAWAGALAMALSDLLITGLAFESFANVPAMALVGAMGGVLGRRGTPGRVEAAVAGIVATALFSVSADLATWALAPEFRAGSALGARVLAGLAFNVVPAAINAVLFAAAVGPVASAVRALSAGGPRPATRG